MSPWLADPDVTLYHGDNLDVLRELPSGSVHMCATSPPFYGLRDYGTGLWDGGDPDCDHQRQSAKSRESSRLGMKDGNGPYIACAETQGGTYAYGAECGKCGARRVDQQIGLEATPDEWVARLVAVFREVRRVLRDDGTLWVEIGDSYSNVPRGDISSQANRPSQDGSFTVPSSAQREARASFVNKLGLPGVKQKDLLGQPWLLAFALRADGWYLRSEIIWARPNPMPESVTDRPTKSHSTVFLLSKQPRYFYDADAIREEFQSRPQQRLTKNVDMPLGAARVAAGVQQGNPQGGTHVNRFRVQDTALIACDQCGPSGCGREWTADECGCACHAESPATNGASGANARSVWTIPTQPTPFAHFATWPEALVRRMILAGTSERGCCPECGAPWTRDTETTQDYYRAPKERVHNGPHGTKQADVLGHSRKRVATLGWSPSCPCATQATEAEPLRPVPCTVLDPFAGSATTMLVARNHGRHSIGIELNQEYLMIAAKRLQQLSLLAEPC